MTELNVGAPTGLPDLAAMPDPQAAAAPPPAPLPPPPAGWPIEAAAGIAKFPFAFLAERPIALPIVGVVGGRPHWRLSDGEADLLAPAIKYYLDSIAPAGTPGQQLLLGLGIVVGTRVAMDRAELAAMRAQQGRRPPATVAPADVPSWAAAEAQAAASPPVIAGDRDTPPSRTDFWAGANAVTRPA